MEGLTYTLRLLDPVLANSLAGDANSARSLKFLPGSLMRGALVGLYQERETLEAGGGEARRLFFGGETRFLHAYPVVDSARGLPLPLSWHEPKYSSGKEGYDLAVEDYPDDDQLKNKIADFCRLRDETVQSADPTTLRLNVHTQRDARLGRATKQHGAVYRYEALPVDTLLEGVILTDAASDRDALKALLRAGRVLVFGKARTAGYGRALVTRVDELGADWQEASGAGDGEYFDESERLGLSDGDDITLTLLSEAVVRDDNGQHTPHLLPALARFLRARGLAVAECRKTFRRGEIVGGFNRKWGLPLPQVWAVAAGSVFVCRARRQADDVERWRDALRELEARGLGERRAEGFGRLAINWHAREAQLLIKTDEKDKGEGEVAGAERAELDETEEQLTQFFLKRLLRRDLDALLRAAVQQIGIKGHVHNSQLSRWRTIIRSASAQGDINRLNDFYDREESKKSSGWKAMHRARVGKGGPRLTEWMRDVLSADDGQSQAAKGSKADGESDALPIRKVFWDFLSVKGVPERALGEGLSLKADEELRVEYQLRLLDGVLAKRIKEQSNEKRGEEGASDE